MKKRLLAALAAAVMTLLCFASALPALAIGESATKSPTPAGYDEHDYQKMLAFMEQTDENGVKNGDKIAAVIGKEYDPGDPETWYGEYYYEEWDTSFNYGIVWNYWDNTDQHQLARLNLYSFIASAELAGELDASGCSLLYYADCAENQLTAIDVSETPALYYFVCRANRVTELNVSGAPTLNYLDCRENQLTELDVSGSPALDMLMCGNNQIAELDVSACPALGWLECAYNQLTELDVSCCPGLVGLNCTCNMLTELDVSNGSIEYLSCEQNRLTTLRFSNDVTVTAEGGGCIGFISDHDEQDSYYAILLAEPTPGCELLGWYSEEGELLSDEPQIDFFYGSCSARFTGGETPPALSGDVNGDGNVDMTDALLVMRFALGMLTDLPVMESADVNGSGTVDMADALIILRVSLGLMEL